MATARVKVMNCGNDTPAALKTCRERLSTMYQTYIDLISGKNVADIMSADGRRVTYGPGNLNQLIAEYNALHAVCGQTDLPRIALGRARRGGPAYFGC